MTIKLFILYCIVLYCTTTFFFPCFISIFRSLKLGLIISVDYKWNLWKLEEDSKEYNDAIKLCHKRAAERLLVGCLKNGGLYVKLGQGLVSLNHVLPREYVETLVVLQDRALMRHADEVCNSSIQFKTKVYIGAEGCRGRDTFFSWEVHEYLYCIAHVAT